MKKFLVVLTLYLATTPFGYSALKSVGPPINTLQDQVCVVLLSPFYPVAVPFIWLIFKASKMKPIGGEQ